MFKKKLKITSITSTAAGDFLFTMGLGKDGKVYLWNSQLCQWQLHKSIAPAAEQPNGQ